LEIDGNLILTILATSVSGFSDPINDWANFYPYFSVRSPNIQISCFLLPILLIEPDLVLTIEVSTNGVMPHSPNLGLRNIMLFLEKMGRGGGVNSI